MTQYVFQICCCLFFGALALPAAAREAIHLHLLGAAPRHGAVLVVLEVDGETLRTAAVAEPYRTESYRGSLIGNLHVDEVPVDQLSWDGARLQGRLELEDAFTIEVDATRDDHTLRGRYGWRDVRGDRARTANGEIHGILMPVPRPEDADLLTLYIRNPVPGHPDGGRNNRHSRAIATVTLAQGEPETVRLVASNTHASSRHTRQSFPVALSGGAVGLQVVGTEDHARLLTDPKVSRDDDQWRIEVTHEGQAVHYLLNLRNVGDLVFGNYEIEGDPEHERQEVAGYLGKSGHLEYPVSLRDDAPRGANELQTHLRWLMDVNPYGGGLFGNDMALGDVRNTGSKDYNDPPMVGAFAPMVARAVLSVQDDPVQRARAHMVGLRGGQYILSHRTGPLNLLPTYKTKFRPQYWMGRALVDLAVISESDYWKARALEVADALRRTQDRHGSWSYVDARTGRVGTTLSRHDRSWDHVPRANGMWLDLLGRIRTELGVEDYRDVEDRAAAWMRTALLEGITHQGRNYLIEGRNHNSRPDDDGPTFYALYQLRYADEWDQALFDATIEWAELLLFEGDDRLLRARYYQPRAPTGIDAVGTMRMALIYALSAEKTGNAEHLQKAGLLFNTVENMYRSRNGIIWDSGVWDSPDVRTWSYHAYQVLPGEIAVNLIDFMEAAERLEKAGTPVPVPQAITFPDLADQPGEAALLDPGATSDAGLTVRYEVDLGPATVENGKLNLSGETGVVWVTAYQDGNERVLPALSLQRSFAVGEALPPPPPAIQTRSLNNRTVEISWEPSPSENIVHYTVEESRDEGESWRQAGRVDEETHSVEIANLQRGETRLFRVRAHNPSFVSDPSPVASASSHAENFHREIDLASDVRVGKHWTFRPGEGPDESGVFVPSEFSRSPEPNDDLSISFTIDIGEQTGRYDVYYQCWGNAGSNDTAWIGTQNDERWHWLSIGNQGWTWRVRGLELNEPGEHTIYFGARQRANDGPRIGRIIVTNTRSRNVVD